MYDVILLIWSDLRINCIRISLYSILILNYKSAASFIDITGINWSRMKEKNRERARKKLEMWLIRRMYAGMIVALNCHSMRLLLQKKNNNMNFYKYTHFRDAINHGLVAFDSTTSISHMVRNWQKWSSIQQFLAGFICMPYLFVIEVYFQKFHRKHANWCVSVYCIVHQGTCTDQKPCFI